MRKLTRGLAAFCLTAALVLGQAALTRADEAYGPGYRNGVSLSDSSKSEKQSTAASETEGGVTTEEAETALANAGIDIGKEGAGGGEDGVVDEATRAAQEALKANFPRLQTTVMIGDGNWTQPFVNDAWITNDGQGFHGLSTFLTNIVGNVLYRTYTSGTGWSPWVMNGQQTTNYPNDVNIEAIQMRFSGYVNNQFNLYYSAKLDDGTTTDWAKNGTSAGTMGTGHYITGFRMAFYAKNSAFPYKTDKPLISATKDGMQIVDGGLRYFNGDGTPFTGWAWIENDRYYFKDSLPVVGWQYIDGFKYYFDLNSGKMLTDLEPIIGNSGPFFISINKQMNCMTVFAKDGANGFIIPVKSFLTSTGPDTPLGTFQTPVKYRWRDMDHGIFTQYATRIWKGFLIHSILYSRPDKMTLDPSTYNYLSIAESAGCIRLLSGDAKWIYDHCALGTTVTIYESPVPGPYERPAIEQIIPDTQTWDPTDPNM
ncbi:L,D-transpeptidase family protein [Lacrimispora sp. AGF001]|uniref:L,D-transpeptidase n=1 Tax=Lacrimispora sp. AGF001 TaxID=3401631 RepID=UPI003B4324D8|nr:L,D-transpeptidase [Paenibacillaceae bacterium]